MKKTLHIAIFLLLSITLFSGCTTTGGGSVGGGMTRSSKQRAIQNHVYAYSGTLRANTTERGVVVQSRPVEIRLEGNNVAQLIGATIGGVGGYAAGDGDELATAAGALVGGFLGNMAHTYKTIPGQEVVVRLVGDSYYKNELITIVQGADEPLPANQEVFIITGASRSASDVRLIPFYRNPDLRLRHRNLDSEEVDQQGNPYISTGTPTATSSNSSYRTASRY